MEFEMLCIMFAFTLSVALLIARTIFQRKIAYSPTTKDGFVDLEINTWNIIMFRLLSVLTVFTFAVGSITNIVLYAPEYTLTNILNIIAMTLGVMTGLFFSTPEKNYDSLNNKLAQCSTITLVLSIISLIAISIFS